MTHEMKGLLLEDRWAPVTEEMGFLELGAEQAAQAFATWQRGLPTSRGFTVEVLPVTGTLEQVLSRLLPLSGGETQRRPVHPDAQRLDCLRREPVDRDGCRQPHERHGPEAEHPLPAGGRRAPHAARGRRRPLWCGDAGCVRPTAAGEDQQLRCARWALPMTEAAGSSTSRVSPSPSSRWSSTRRAR